MLINELSKLFVYVPSGYGKAFIDNYAQTDEYKQKIAFVQDTREIYTNGHGFGIPYGEFQDLMTIVRSNTDRIVELENKQEGDTSTMKETLELLQGDVSTLQSDLANLQNTVSDVTDDLADLRQDVSTLTDDISQDVTTLSDRLDVIEGDENTEGSIKQAIKNLQDLILGDSEHLQETLDTIAEIDKWITDHGQEYVELVDNVSANTAAIEEEKERALAAESDLEERVAALEGIQIWDTFDPDFIPVTDDTVVGDTADDITNIDNPQDTDVVVNTQDAMSFFTNDSNGSTTFQNITI